MRLVDLPTPCALVELDILDRNTRRMSAGATALGVRLRPHVKTHKCLEAAHLQVRGHFGGITVSTLAEARFFGEGGFRNITYACPVPLPHLDKIARIQESLDRLNLLLDHPRVAAELEEFACSHGVRFSVFLKLDCGYHRAGVDPESEKSIRLASTLHDSEWIDFQGILTHAGHAYDCKARDEIERIAEQERSVAARFAEKLRGAGIPSPEVSVGSTPTMNVVRDLTGVTETRPGNYVFHDAFQAAIGSCTLDDVAYTILATVTGHYPDQNKLIINAGALALSKDEGARHVDPNCGYGVLLSVHGGERYPELKLTSLSQEHGQVHGTRPLDLERYPIGSRLRIIPNHSCLAAIYDRYYVVRGENVIDEWKPVRGW